jgi:hypothetical protein
MTPVPDFVAGARALLAASRNAPQAVPSERAELRDLPAEVRRLVHAVDRLRDDWLESSPQRCEELMQRTYEACDAVWNRAPLLAASDCTIDGEPAVVVRVAELNDLVARVHRAEAAAGTAPDNPAVAAPATADDGLREQYAAAIDEGFRTFEEAQSEDAYLIDALADSVMAFRDHRIEQLTVRAEGVERSVQLLTTDLLKVAQQRDQAEATVARVRALAADMRTWCSRNNIAVDYAQRIDDALDGPEADRA